MSYSPVGRLVVLTLDVTVPGGDGNSKAFTISGTLPDGWSLTDASDSTPDAKVLLTSGMYSVAVQTFPNGSDVEAGSKAQVAIGGVASLDGIGGYTGQLADGGDWSSYASAALPTVPVSAGEGFQVSLQVSSTGDMVWAGQLILCRISDLPV